MRTDSEEQRQAAADTLKEVMRKLEEALQLSRRLEEDRSRPEHTSNCTRGEVPRG